MITNGGLTSIIKEAALVNLWYCYRICLEVLLQTANCIKVDIRLLAENRSLDLMNTKQYLRRFVL
jgi:hypothetical protein